MSKLFVQTMLAAVLVSGISGPAFAGGDEHSCSVRTLRGRYVFSASGFNIDAVSRLPVPKALIEVIDFNGDGSLEVTGATRSQNGVISRSPSSVGTYTVAEDCTGTITFAGTAFDIFLSPKGHKFWLIQTNPDSVFQGSATRTVRELNDDHDRH